MKTVLATCALVAALVVTRRGEACDQHERGQGHLEVIPAAGGVVPLGGTSAIEGRMGAGAQLGLQLGWQLCEPKLFLGAGISYALFAYDGDKPDLGRIASQLRLPSLHWVTSHPGLIDVYASTRVHLAHGFGANALVGATSSDLIRARAVVPTGSVSPQSLAPFAQDLKSEGGAVLGLGLDWAFGEGGAVDKVDAFAVTIGLEPRLHVFGSGTIWTLPIVVSVPIPLD